MHYDAEGRREFSTNRRGKTTQTIYDALGRVINSVFLGSGSDSAVTSAQPVMMPPDAFTRAPTQTIIHDQRLRRLPVAASA
jgi:YD repeat-containing protein